MPEELKPCPCCGETKPLFYYDYPVGALTVCCGNCGMRGPATGYSKDGAIRTWNALPRHADIELVERERDWIAEKYKSAFNELRRPDRMTVAKAVAMAKETTCSKN